MIIHYRQEVETTLVTIDRGMDKENVVYIYMEYYSVLKNKKILSRVTTWMDLGDNEISHSIKEANTAWFHFYAESKTVKLVEAKVRMVISRAGGGENG